MDEQWRHILADKADKRRLHMEIQKNGIYIKKMDT